MSSPAQRMMDIFAGNEGQHGTHGVPDLDPNGYKWSIKRTARTIKKPVTLTMWQDHLSGKRPLGIVPIREDSTCLWGSIDIDQYDIDLIDVVRRVEDASLPLVPCRSKSGGLHLWIFFCEPINAATVQNVLRDMSASLGFAGSEVFPKQTKILVEHGDMGNWIVMPYFGGDYDGKLKMQHGLKKNGAEMTIGEFLTVAEKRRITTQQLQAMIQTNTSSNVVQLPVKGKNGNGNGHGKPYSDGPPCLQHLAANGFPDGGRNNALFHIGVYLKKAHPADWKKHLEMDNQSYMKPPLPSDEVDGVIKSLENKDYEYKCKDQPMQSHCNSITCRRRKHGVGIGGSYPEILGLDKLETEPPMWFVDLSGGHRIPMSTDELQKYKLFHKLCMEHANACYKAIPDAVWFSIVNEAMEKMTTLVAPEEIGAGGVFKEQLETFLTNRMRGKIKDDILRDAPWEDEEKGRHYFTIKALEKYLVRDGMRDVKRPVLKMRLEKLGGGHGQMTIKKGINRYVWWVPSAIIQNAPELDTPPLPKDIL